MTTYRCLSIGNDSMNSQGRVSASYAEEDESHTQLFCKDDQCVGGKG